MRRITLPPITGTSTTCRTDGKRAVVVFRATAADGEEYEITLPFRSVDGLASFLNCAKPSPMSRVEPVGMKAAFDVAYDLPKETYHSRIERATRMLQWEW